MLALSRRPKEEETEIVLLVGAALEVKMYCRKLILTSVLSLSCIAMCSSAEAASHYVNNSGSPACSNSSSYGSSAKPWCSINYGLYRMAGGDTLYIMAGTYNELPVLYAGYYTGPSGTAGAHTVIQAYPGNTVILNGPGVNASWFRFRNMSYVDVSGLTITNDDIGIRVDGGSNHLTFTNVVVHDVGQQGISVVENSSYITITGSTIHDTGEWNGCASGPCNGEGIYVGTCEGCTPRGDNTNHVTISNNWIYNTETAVQLKRGTHDCIIDGNTLGDSNIVRTSGYSGPIVDIGDVAGPDQVWSSNANMIVRNNFIYNNGGSTQGTYGNSGLYIGLPGKYYNNVIYGITASKGWGIYINNATGDTFAREVYHNTIDTPIGGGGAVNNQDTQNTVDMRNNIGPTGSLNLAFNSTYFVNASAHNYSLVAGSAPIGAGANLLNIVPTDIVGTVRTNPPDIGAYQHTN